MWVRNCHGPNASFIKNRNPNTSNIVFATRPGNTTGGASKMLQYIAENCRDPELTVARIARHANLHPNYANDNFRKTCGISLMRYVSQQRVAHAQCLLVATGAKVLDIAMDAGFGSVSQFYQVFRAITGISPREYASRATESS